MSDIVATLDSQKELETTLELQDQQLATIKAKKEELKEFNIQAADKLIEVNKQFG